MIASNTEAVPRALEPDLEAIPSQLRELPQWVAWSFEKRDDKWTKVPVVAGGTGGRASTTNPQTWRSFEQAAKFYETVGTAGIGFVFSADDPYVGIDLDDCRDLETGEIEPWARSIIDAFDTYAEVSPSGTGVKLFLRGRLAGKGTRKKVDGGEIEVYDRGRYFAVTGRHVEGTPETIEERQDAISALYGRLRNGKPAHKDTPSCNGRAVPQPTPGRDWAKVVASLKEIGDPKLRRLLEGDTSMHDNDDSRAAPALCAILAHADFSKGDVDRIVRHSGLYRSKWDSKRGNSTWGWQTIDFAFSGLKSSGDSSGEDEQAIADRAQEIVVKASEAGNADLIFSTEHVEVFARLPLSVWATTKRQAKEAFGSQVNLNDLERAVAQQRKEAKRERREAVVQKFNDRPQIVVNDRPTKVIAFDAAKALEAANAPPVLFVRSGEIVRVDHDEAHRPVIRLVDEMRLRHTLARSAYCMRATEDGRRHVHPPLDVVRDVLSAGEWPFPALVGITEGPVLRPDGTVLDRPGYDLATGLVYTPCPGLTVPDIPAHPLLADAKSAFALIEETLGEFPYADNSARANAVAGMLTPIVRQFIRGCAPLEVIDAPAAGSGKTLLANAKALIATGRPAALMTAPHGDDEMRKRITAALGEGTTVINIDNVERPLSHPSLSAALTATVWQDRRLGTNDTISLPQRASWIATGNNVRLSGDIPRRSYWVRLDAQVARPWQRSGFRHPDLLGWVAEHRGELLGALLTMTRAWIVAGKPRGDVPTLGGFEQWAETVGGILSFVGVRGFLGNLESMYDHTDDETPQWEAFLAAWTTLFKDRPVTVAELNECLREPSALREQLPDDLAEAFEGPLAGFQRRLGKALAKRVDTRYGEDAVHLVRAGEDPHRKVVRWKVLRGLRGLPGLKQSIRVKNGPTLEVSKVGGGSI